MGRETFLVPVIWEEGWPVVSWETGKIEEAHSLSGYAVKRDIEDSNATAFPAVDDFNTDDLASYWLSLRKRDPAYINCKENSGVLRLYGAEPVSSDGNVSMVVRRQTGFSFEASCKADFHFDENEDTAGIICFQNEKYNYRLQLTLKGKIIILQLVRAAGGDDEILAEEVMTGGRKNVQIVLRVVAEHQKLSFEYGPDERNMMILAENIDASILSTDVAGGFVGTVVGMFAVAGGDWTQKKFFTDFDWFRYENSGREWIC
jgi:alpha-N-arabinofuranosidase